MENDLPDRLSRSRNWSKPILFWVRRTHLFLGLLLFPWVVLYGATAYLFNHPTAWADRPTIRFSADVLKGTELSPFPSPESLAKQVVEQLNVRFQPQARYRLDEQMAPRFADEYLFGRVDREEEPIQFLLHTRGTGGTIRIMPTKPVLPTSPSPEFIVNPGAIPVVASVSTAEPAASIEATAKPDPSRVPLKIEPQLDRRIVEEMPKVFKEFGIDLQGKPVIVTSIPDLIFQINTSDSADDFRLWVVRYNILKGSVNAVVPEAAVKEPLSWRQRLLRLHTAHGYPDEVNARWWWAVIADVMAFVLIGWGVSGLFMWWQLKATRRWA